MLPNHRHTLLVLIVERSLQDRTPVGAPKSELRGPSTEVRSQSVIRMHQAVLRRRVTEVQSGFCSHFDCSFRLLDLRRSQSAASFCLATAICPFTLVARTLRLANSPLVLAAFRAGVPADLCASLVFALVFSSCLCLSRNCLLSRAALAFSAALLGLSFSLAARSFLALPFR